MRAWTQIEIREERDRLEREAATILGYMLFEYSRLDMELGLFLVWSNEGKELDKLTTKLSEYNFNKRLEVLQKLVQAKYADTPQPNEIYASWLADAHETRSIRNQLFHGRWGVNPIQQQVVNILGLPTSPEQQGTPYSIADLQNALETMRALRARLQDLRKSWPV
ncbi:MAG: hypothetical protein E6Q82_04645 [Thiobacillus sp.]|nr:MAG: hypothetical protein E6Q82_04645 [Thiobacillus sp.]